MFNSLSDRLQDTFDKLRGKGRLTEDDINLAMREIRMALLEADVNFRVVKQFVGRCKEKCMASEVLDSLTPSQNVVRIVLDELTQLLGSTESAPSWPTSSRARATARFWPPATRTARRQPTSWPPLAARLTSRSTAATARTPSRWRPAPSRRPSTT